jgi:geranylgeranyl pyrophosphate synthase
MAFQIIDDVLDLREGTDTLGKPAGNDLRQGIVTLPTMYYAEGLEEGGSGRDTLLAIVEGEITDDATIDDLVDDIRRSGALARAEYEAHVFADAARNRLDVVADQETRRLLEATLDLTLERIS